MTSTATQNPQTYYPQIQYVSACVQKYIIFKNQFRTSVTPPASFRCGLSYPAVEKNTPIFLSANKITNRNEYLDIFGKVEYSSSDHLDNDAINDVLNSSNAVITSMLSAYGITANLDDVKPSWTVKDIMVFLKGAGGVLPEDMMNYVSDQQGGQLGFVNPSKLDMLTLSVDDSLNISKPVSSKYYNSLLDPSSLFSNKATDEGDTIASVNTVSSKSDVLFPSIPIGPNYGQSLNPEKNVEMPPELNLQTPLVRGSTFPLDRFKVVCSYSGDYTRVDIDSPVFPTVIRVLDNSTSSDLGAFWSQAIRNGVLNETLYRSFCSLVTSYRWGYAKQPSYPSTTVPVSGYLVKFMDKYPLGQQAKKYNTSADLSDVEDLQDGELYADTYRIMYTSREMKDDYAEQYLTMLLQDVLPKTGLFGRDGGDPIYNSNIVFQLSDRSCSPSDIIAKASTLNWPKLFKGHDITTEIQVIMSALLISLANKRETVAITGIKNETTYYYRWTLFPLKNVSSHSQTRFFFNTAVFITSMIAKWLS